MFSTYIISKKGLFVYAFEINFRRNGQIAYIVYTYSITVWQYISKIKLEITIFS